MSSMNRSGEAPAANRNESLDPNALPSYNLDDFAFPTFVPRALQLTNLSQDVRTWRELSDFVRANLRALPPYTLERALSLQADYANAGPAQRTNIPAMIPTISHGPVRGGGKGRGGSTHRVAPTVTPTKTNINVPGAAQSQGLAQIAIGPREFPSDGKEMIPAKVTVAPGVPREIQSQSSHKEAMPAKASATPRTRSTTTIPTRGPPTQTVVKPVAAATFEQTKPATAKPAIAKPVTANTTKGASQGMQKLGTAKAAPSLRSASVSLNTKERVKTSKSAQDGHGVGKTGEGLIHAPVGELIDLSIPASAKPLVTLPQMLHHGIPGYNSYMTPVQDNRMMSALAAIPALVPTKKYNHQSQDSIKEPLPPNPVPATLPPHLQLLSRAGLPPPLQRTPSQHSGSTHSRSPNYSRSPSPEEPKPTKSVEQPKQAGRYYLVWVNGQPDYVWVAGAQRGDPPPPYLDPVKYESKAR